VLADYTVAHHWQIATEINFIRKGIRIPNSARGYPIEGTTTFTASYVEIPIKIRFRAGGGPFWWYLEAGPLLGLLHSARAFMVNFPVAGFPQWERTNDAGAMYRNLQPSVLAGLGAEYELSNSVSLALSASYVHGLSDVFAELWSHAKARGVQCDIAVLLTP
jgi:hypothetical protein